MYVCAHTMRTYTHNINSTHPCEYGVHKLRFAVYISLLYMCVNVCAFVARHLIKIIA